MRKDGFSFILIALALLVLAFWFEPSLRDQDLLDYRSFAFTMRQVYYIAALFLFIAFLGALRNQALAVKDEAEDFAPYTSTSSPKRATRGWTLFVVVGLLFVVALNYYTNAHAFFVSDNFNGYFIYRGMRLKKLQLFEQLETPPKIVLFGSSKAQWIPADYASEELGLSTFNMAVLASTPIDAYSQLRFILDQNEEHPELIIFEIFNPSLESEMIRTNIAQVAYLQPREVVQGGQLILYDTLNKNTFVDSLFVLASSIKQPEIVAPRYQLVENGTRIGGENSEAGWERVLEDPDRLLISCTELDPVGVEYFRLLVELASENNIAVLVYRSPYTFERLDKEEVLTPDILSCDEAFDAFMHTLDDSYNNFSYVNLFYDEYIPSFRWQAYYDRHHLTNFGGRLLIDQLAPEVSNLLSTE